MYSKLDIINSMLQSTGSAPLTAEQNRHPLYRKAEGLLERVKLDVQLLGLWFNTECRDVPSQTNGELRVPNYCIQADPADGNLNYTLRGNRMYNLDTGNFTVGKAVRLNMRFDVPFDEMPMSARSYIRAKAVYEFYLDEDGADPKLSNYRNERDKSWAILYREHLRNVDQNVFRNPKNAVNRLRRGYAAVRLGGYGT